MATTYFYILYLQYFLKWTLWQHIRFEYFKILQIDKNLIVPILIFVGYLNISKVMSKNGESSFGNNKLGWPYLQPNCSHFT